MISISERLNDESDLIRKFLGQHEFNLRVACPGIIKSFDSDTQTAEVRPAIKEKVVIDGIIQWRELPLLVDVPVVFPRAGGFSLTFPIIEGDECLVIFGDSCIDAWWQSGEVQNPIEQRRHDLSDGFAILGPWSQPKKILNYSVLNVQLRNELGTSVIEIDPLGNIIISGLPTLTLAGPLINLLCEALTMNGEPLSMGGPALYNNVGGNSFVLNGDGSIDISCTGPIRANGTPIYTPPAP